MIQVFENMNPKRLALIIALTMLGPLSFSAAAKAQSQEPGSRQIVLDEFTKARPAKNTSASTSAPNQTARKRPPSAGRVARRPTYHRVGGLSAVSAKRRASSSIERHEELGVTLWRLRQSKPNDGGARLLVMENAQSTQWTPERMEVDTPLNVGERVRISVESPRVGYLYVVDREQYADGSLGDAYVIFPTTRTRGGDNQVTPGRLIDIPEQEDNPNYFTLTPSPNRSDQVAEVLSFIVTLEPLDGLTISDKPLMVTRSDINKWEKNWSALVERFELNGGAGSAWTNEEKEASATSSRRLLTPEEPAPQTVYRIAAKATGSLLVTVPLRYRR